jgi:hypothetical protein
MAQIRDDQNTEDPTVPLTPYRGMPVTQVVAKLTNTGDGLSQAMHFRKAEIPIGTIVTVAVECVVTRHGYEQIEDKDGPVDEMQLTLVMKGGRATLVPDRLVADYQRAEAARISEGKAAARGQDPMPGTGATETDLGHLKTAKPAKAAKASKRAPAKRAPAKRARKAAKPRRAPAAKKAPGTAGNDNGRVGAGVGAGANSADW